MARSDSFRFDGGAADYFGTAFLATLITFITLGFGLPWALCMRQSWKTKHTIVNGVRLHFSGTGGGLFGQWIKWWLLMMVTIGIYGFWVIPQLNRWIVEHTDFDQRSPLPPSFLVHGTTYVPLVPSAPPAAFGTAPQPPGALPA
jgi:uncharacterized membrane protein YjgN (DUF898 family)